MCSITRFVIVACVLAFAGLGLSAVQAAEQKQTADQKQTTLQKQGQDQRRYTFHNGEWWYWLPTSRWVYWRDNRWNDYKPQTYVSPHSSAIVTTGRVGPSYGSQADSDSDIHPFYGRTIADLDRRPVEENGEIGPFYGNALPSDVFGARRTRGFRPFYGRAVSSYGY
jgi:hypothetical protein